MTTTNGFLSNQLRLTNNDTSPYPCTANATGVVFFHTVTRGMQVCDGSVWRPVGPVCATPGDLTSHLYRHWGSGNCPPHFGDQSWLSRDDALGESGWHDSVCQQSTGVSPQSFAAIEFPAPTVIKRFRALLHTYPPKNCTFQGSVDTSKGMDGTWRSLYGPFDFTSDQEGQWSSYHTFANNNAFNVYRLYCPGTPPHSLYEWEMFCY